MLLLDCLYLTAPVLAQEEPQEPTSAGSSIITGLVAEAITVVDRAARSSITTATTIDREAIERANVSTAGDLIRYVSGVHVLSSGSRGGPALTLSRGGDVNFTIILLDGVPLNDSTDVQGGGFNLATLPVDQIESVEVMNGGQSHFFGSNALAGAINLRTRNGKSEERRLSIGAGDNSLRRAGFSIGAPTGSANYFVGGDYEESKWTLGEDAFEQSNLQGSFGIRLSSGSDLRVVGRYSDSTVEDYPESSGGPAFGSGDLRNTDAQQYSLGLNLTLNAGSWSHGGSLGISRSATAVDSPAIFPLVPPSIEDREYTRSQLNWTSKAFVSNRVHLAAGGQLDRERANNMSLLKLPPAFGGNVIGDYHLSRTTPGAFVDTTVMVSNLTLAFGLRADDPENLDVEWSPRVGLNYRFASRWQLRSSWSEAFKLPSFFALASPPALGGNPDLLPETSNGGDLGIEWKSGRARAGVTLFSIRYQELIDFDFNTFSHINRSEVEAEGYELFAHFQPLEKLRIETDWTVQNVTDRGSPDPLLNMPEWFGSLRLTFVPTEAVQLRLEARFVDDSADTQLSIFTRDSVEGYEVVDLALAWQILPKWRLTARLDNVLDKDYEVYIGFPHPGRTARLGLRFDFR